MNSLQQTNLSDHKVQLTIIAIVLVLPIATKLPEFSQLHSISLLISVKSQI